MLTASRASSAACRSLALSSALPLSSEWSLWAVLLCASAFGLTQERTRLGATLSGPIVTTLVGLVLSNVGVIPAASPVYTAVTSFLLPLSVPLLLFGADLRRVVRETGRLLGAFSIGAVGVVLGSLLAIWLCPMAQLGEDAWKVTAALCARHIGGAVNYVAVAEALSISPSLVAAGLAADNLACAVYFSALFALAGSGTAEEGGLEAARESSSVDVSSATTALAVSAVICAVAVGSARALGWHGADIPLITALVVALATFFPSRLAPLVDAGAGTAKVLLHFFFAVVGACGSIRAVFATAPALFLVSALQMSVHLALLLWLGGRLGYTRPALLIASNANVGGPTTAAGMAATLGWRSLLVPAILLGVFGYAIATFLAIGLGHGLFRPLWLLALAR